MPMTYERLVNALQMATKIINECAKWEDVPRCPECETALDQDDDSWWCPNPFCGKNRPYKVDTRYRVRKET